MLQMLAVLLPHIMAGPIKKSTKDLKKIPTGLKSNTSQNITNNDAPIVTEHLSTNSSQTTSQVVVTQNTTERSLNSQSATTDEDGTPQTTVAGLSLDSQSATTGEDGTPQTTGAGLSLDSQSAITSEDGTLQTTVAGLSLDSQSVTTGDDGTPQSTFTPTEIIGVTDSISITTSDKTSVKVERSDIGPAGAELSAASPPGLCQEPDDLADRLVSLQHPTFIKGPKQSSNATMDTNKNRTFHFDRNSETWTMHDDTFHVKHEGECPIPSNIHDLNVNERALCPWRYVINHDPNRLPAVLMEAKCVCDQCRGHNSGDSKTGHCYCQNVYYSVQVLKKESGCVNGRYIYTPEHINIQVSCVCARRR